MAIFDRFWPFLTVFLHFFVIFDGQTIFWPFWPFLAIFGHFGHFMYICDIFRYEYGYLFTFIHFVYLCILCFICLIILCKYRYILLVFIILCHFCHNWPKMRQNGMIHFLSTLFHKTIKNRRLTVKKVVQKGVIKCWPRNQTWGRRNTFSRFSGFWQKWHFLPKNEIFSLFWKNFLFF